MPLDQASFSNLFRAAVALVQRITCFVQAHNLFYHGFKPIVQPKIQYAGAVHLLELPDAEELGKVRRQRANRSGDSREQHPHKEYA